MIYEKDYLKLVAENESILSDNAEQRARIVALEAERDHLQDKLADAESSMLRRFDPAAAESTDLFTWITCMLAERDRLRAELQNSQNKLKASGRAKLREEVAALRAELEECKRDAERWRKFQEVSTTVDVESEDDWWTDVKETSFQWTARVWVNGKQTIPFPTLESAIDAALAGEGECT